MNARTRLVAPFTRSLAVILILTAALGCGERRVEEAPGGALSRADSLATAVLDAMGGADAWRALRFLSFEFASEQDGVRRPGIRHLWDRHTGDYRVSWSQNDTSVVALFNVTTREGTVFADGERLDSAAAEPFLRRAYTRFINDTYWMLMPVKLMDPGVTRTYLPDSSDAENDVLNLTFTDVGLTAGDTYWIYVDRTTGLVNRWAFVLQGNPDAPPSYFSWDEWRTFDGPAGPVRISTRKQRANRAILTDNIETPATVDPSRFTEP